MSDLSNANLRVYGGLLLTDAEIKNFLDAPGEDRRKTLPAPMTPSNDITAYLEQQGCLSQMYPCILKPLDTPEIENPSLTLLLFTGRRIVYGDVEFTDVGVVPKKIPAASDEAKSAVRRWLGLDPAGNSSSDSKTDAHVEDLAARISYMAAEGTNFSNGIGWVTSDQIANLFGHIATITGKERRELQFYIVYNEDDMRRIMSLHEWSVKALAEEKANELAQSTGAAPSQRP